MKRVMMSMICMTLSGALALPVVAQPQSAPPPQPQQPAPPAPGGQPGEFQQGGRGFAGGGGGFAGQGQGGFNAGRGERGGRGGGGGRGGPGGPPIDVQKYEALRSYLDTVDRLAELANDPTASGVAAVVTASDILRQGPQRAGPNAAIEYFTKALPDVKNAAVTRAIHIQLADLYRQNGQTDKALEHLDILLKSTAIASPAPTPSAR